MIRQPWGGRFAALGISFALLLCSAPGRASMVLDLSEEDMLARSDLVGVASVGQVHAQQAPDGSVVTLATLQIHRPVRGCQEGDEVVLLLPGGTLYGLVHEVSGAPRLRPGQMVLTFAERHGPTYRPLGLAMGVYYVEGARQRPWAARRHLVGLTRMDASHALSKQARVGRQPVEHSEPLDALLARLDRYQAAAAAPQ